MCYNTIVMKILPIKGFTKAIGVSVIALSAACLSSTSAQLQPRQTSDTFEKTTQIVPPKGTEDVAVLDAAPSPNVTIQGKKRVAVFVIDITKNILYQYDKDGVPIAAYSVASGKKSTPTAVGVRRVSHIETYPYKTAPKATKRRKHPNDYGPKLICIEMLNPKTGETWFNGEFIHGNNDPSSIGKHASKGCIRMDNDVIKKLAKEVKRGDIIIIQK